MKHLKMKKILASVLVATIVIGAMSEGVGLLSKVSAGTSEIAVYAQPDEDAALVEYIPRDTVAETIGFIEDKDGTGWYKIIWGHDDIGFEGYITEENAKYLFSEKNSIMSVFLGDDRIETGIEAFPEDYQALLLPLQEAHPNWTFEPYYVQPTWDTVVYEEMKARSNYVHTTEVFSMKHLSVYDWLTDSFIGGSGPNWILASQGALEYYLEPRNFITEENIFLFESMRYNEALHTVALVESVLSGTFMNHATVSGYTEKIKLEDILDVIEVEDEILQLEESTEEYSTEFETEEQEAEQISEEESEIEEENEQEIEQSSETNNVLNVGDEIVIDGEFVTVVSIFEEAGYQWVEVEKQITYAEAFVKIGAEYNVSPVMLASRCRQEQGVNGTSALISGTVPGFEGYYNYFNMQASGNTNADIIKNGLTWAMQQGWNSPYKSLKGGSLAVATNYIMKNQDTLYMQKFDVDPEYHNMYWHQYMGAIASPAAEGRTAKRSYINMGILDSYFVFKIPVYTNRPEVAPAMPTDDTNPNCYLSTITLNNGEYQLGFNYMIQTYTLTVPYECKQLEVNAQTSSTRAQLEGNGTYPLVVGSNEIVLSVTAQTGEVKQYTIKVEREKNREDITSVTVSSAITSWDSLDNAIIKLYDADVTDEDIRNDIEKQDSVLGLENEVTINDAIMSETQYTNTFTIQDVENGTYKIAIYKPGKYVVSVETITVEDEDIEMEPIEMWLYGDVNYDGNVNVLDITQITRNINLKNSIFDDGDEKTKEMRFLATDVNKSGDINVLDITQCIRYINLKTSVFDEMN